ncbi:glycosyltransferase, partial [Campylobacter sp. RM13119]|uniref:glycosyltransferase n=1 Tax=Campylobacter californiensis TaxID=1032243 RepID=UPI00147438F2
MPNYNHAKFLNKRIDSILEQTYKNYEVLLLDDCSTDNSREILQGYADRYPDKIRTLFNETNGKNVFKQWRKGMESSNGDLVWICESDDYCENDFLEKLVEQFKNPGVNIAFGRIQFCDLDDNFIKGLDGYREGAESGIWNETLVRPANKWFCGGFSVNNVIANVGGCIFKRQILDAKVWEEAQTYKILGDWFLYSHIANGGLIAYEPTAVAYFRQHGLNTSVSSFTTTKYYEEHFYLMKTLREMWDIPNETIDKFYSKIDFQYRHFKCEETLGKLEKYVNLEELKNTGKNKKHILIAMLAFHPGGGEFFPINLANALQKEGNIVSLFVLNMNDINQDMYNLVDKRIAIYDSNFVESYGVAKFLSDSAVSVINSHMVSLEAFFLEKHNISIPYFPTLHGSYEACNVHPDRIEKFSKKVTSWIYTADRNLTALQFLEIPKNKLIKLSNAMPIDNEPFSKTRSQLNIKEDTVVFTLVARGIKRKGWRAAIEAFLLLEKEYSNIHLLLVGDGEETDRYLNQYKDHPKITFLGYQSKIHGLYRISDCAIVPTRFEGESYPLCVIQALQTGLPVIATDVGEIKSMLTLKDKKISGIILPNERDTMVFINHLKDAMSKMMIKENRDNFSSISKELSKRYDMSSLAKKYMGIFG